MAKQFSDAELLEFSRQIFEQHPDVGFLYACQDGNFFRDVDKNHATNFARESKQELRQIELVGSMPHIKGAEQEDPLTRDVTALMQVLSVTEDRARELITEHRGNTAAAVQAVRQEPAAPAAAPAEATPAKAKKSTSKKSANESA